jgi:hypothetical protein
MASVFWWLVVEISWVSYGFLLLASCVFTGFIDFTGGEGGMNKILYCGT